MFDERPVAATGLLPDLAQLLGEPGGRALGRHGMFPAAARAHGRGGDRQVEAGLGLQPAVVPGKPDESLLVKAVRYRDKDLQMPPKEALTPQDVEVLVRWVKDGAFDPREAPPSVRPIRSPPRAFACGASRGLRRTRGRWIRSASPT